MTKKCKKCKKCKKKKLIITKCRCDNEYCLAHICAENHNCTFEFKQNGREKLKQENPKISPAKVLLI